MISNRAEVFLPSDTTVEDSVLSNQSATDVDTLSAAFASSFESPLINAASGGFVVPSAALRAFGDSIARSIYSLDDIQGEALRIYSREFDGAQEFALATRDASGLWTLQGWQRFNDEPHLSWTAAPTADGFVLIEARLQ